MKPFFTISIVLLIFTSTVILLGCKKSKNTGPNYTSKMGRVRNWHVYFFQSRNWPTSDTTWSYSDTSYYFPDTSFALTIVNGSTINIFSNNFSYNSTDSANGITYFAVKYIPLYSLMYFYTKDCIVYEYDNGNMHETTKQVYYTY